MRAAALRLPASSALGALALSLLALPLLAQEHGGGLREVRPAPPPPSGRSGFFIAGGLGGGYESFQTDGFAWTDEELGATFHLKLGGTPSSAVRLGGELAGWGTDEAGVEEYVGSLMGIVQLYPSPAGGFFLKAGAGFSYFNQQFFDGFFYQEVDDNGFGFNLGAGWDFQVSRGLTIGPVVDYWHHDFGEFKERIWSLGVSIGSL
jgi:opacity protein-like surface antigen